MTDLQNMSKSKFTVYDLDHDVRMQLVSYAKLYFNDNVAEVIKKGIELIKKDEAEVKDRLNNRLTILEDRVAKLEKEAYNES